MDYKPFDGFTPQAIAFIAEWRMNNDRAWFQPKKDDYEKLIKEPAIRFVKDDHKGTAIANRGMSFQFTYIYRTPRLILDANLVYGFRDAKDGHPIYDTVVNTRRFGAGLAAFMPVMKFSSSVLMVTASADYFRESTNVDFYNSNLTMLAIGVLWRHLKK